MRYELQFLLDPAEFLTVAREYLAADPVIGTVPAPIAQRAVDHPGTTKVEDWWMVVRDRSGAVVGAGMRTAPFEPRPVYLMPMPGPAALLVARSLHDRGEPLGGVNGALPAARLCAEEVARLMGGKVRVAQHTRLFELGGLVPPVDVPGRLRLATEDDLELATAWYIAFMDDADEQAGRPRGSSPHEAPTPEDMMRRVGSGHVWLWVDDAGKRVHLTGSNPPSFGVARIGPVYTPPEHRGRGCASAAVAEVSRRIVEAGDRVCLFTDQANPTSNRIYEDLGFRPVVDQANLLVGPT